VWRSSALAEPGGRHSFGGFSWTETARVWIVRSSERSGRRGMPKAAKVLAMTLLQYGGKSVFVEKAEARFWWMLALQGRLFRPRRIVLRPGRANQCHANSLKLWRRGKGRYTIATGYGLSEHGRWFRHTWLFRARPRRLIETTVKRVKYFGVTSARRPYES